MVSTGFWVLLVAMVVLVVSSGVVCESFEFVVVVVV